MVDHAKEAERHARRAVIGAVIAIFFSALNLGVMLYEWLKQYL